MDILERISTATFTGSILLLLPFFAYAAGIDDAVNYKSPPIKAASTSMQAYTIQDIINKLPGALNDKGIYTNNAASSEYKQLDEDPHIMAFNKEKFGECETFYLYRFGSAGHAGFESTLGYLFPENEGAKMNASRGIKNSLAYLKESSQGSKCANRENYLVQIKEVFNAVIQAAQTILQEKQRLVMIAQAAKIQANEEAKIKQQADEKAKADRQAIELAETKGREDRSKKLNSCQKTNEYMLYKTSTSIESGHKMIADAELAIQRQKEGAKISGYVNKQAMYQLGNMIAMLNRRNEEDFGMYKKLGGSAWRIALVKGLPNPCDM